MGQHKKCYRVVGRQRKEDIKKNAGQSRVFYFCFCIIASRAILSKIFANFSDLVSLKNFVISLGGSPFSNVSFNPDLFGCHVIVYISSSVITTHDGIISQNFGKLRNAQKEHSPVGDCIFCACIFCSNQVNCLFDTFDYQRCVCSAESK